MVRGRQDHVRNFDMERGTHRGLPTFTPMAEFLREKMSSAKKGLRIWKAKARQTKAEMARPGDRGYGKKSDDI